MSKEFEKYIVMLKDYNHDKNESLAKLYYRCYCHLIGFVIINRGECIMNEAYQVTFTNF